MAKRYVPGEDEAPPRIMDYISWKEHYDKARLYVVPDKRELWAVPMLYSVPTLDDKKKLTTTSVPAPSDIEIAERIYLCNQQFLSEFYPPNDRWHTILFDIETQHLAIAKGPRTFGAGLLNLEKDAAGALKVKRAGGLEHVSIEVVPHKSDAWEVNYFEDRELTSQEEAIVAARMPILLEKLLPDELTPEELAASIKATFVRDDDQLEELRRRSTKNRRGGRDASGPKATGSTRGFSRGVGQDVMDRDDAEEEDI